jgi:hypothetical protein
MAKYRITAPDGATYEITAPDDATPEQVQAFVQQSVAKGGDKRIDPSKGKGGAFAGFLMGLRDPIDAGAQLLVRGASAVGLAPESEVARVDQLVRDANAEYDASRQLAGREGVDVARIGGNVVNPVNAAPAGLLLRGGTTVGRMALASGAAGGFGGALQPVVGETDFASAKAGQVGLGTVGGAVAGPLASKAGETVMRLARRAQQRLMGGPSEADILMRTGDILNVWARDNGVDLNQVPKSILAGVQKQVADALRAGREPTVDPAAFVRKAEFDVLGIQPTQAQVTRDPVQFTRERNLRSVEGGGEPLAARFAEQQAQLRRILDKQGAERALEPDVAGSILTKSLREVDERAGQKVGQLYDEARALNAGEIPLDGAAFVNRASQALDAEMKGAFLPGEVRGILQQIAEGKIPMNVSTAEQLRTTLATAQRATKDGNVSRALGLVRDALEKTQPAAPLGEQATAAFSRARSANAARMKLREEMPALQAALDDVSPEKFVKQFVINADTRQTNKLLQMLGTDEQAFDQVRAQVASYLRTKAFGPDSAGDGTFRQDAFNKALKEIGTNKLRAIFGFDGADQLQTLGRVASYIQSQPAGSAVNNSNTAGAVMNLLSQMSGRFGSLPMVNVLRDSVRTYANERAARNALLGEVPMDAAQLPPELQSKLLRYFTTPTVLGTGASAGAMAGQ